MRFRDNQQLLPTFELACRTGYLCVLMAIPAVLDPVIRLAPSMYYLWFLAGSAIMFFATFPLGHSPLGADLRGVIGYGIALEIAFAILFFDDDLLSIYRICKPYFSSIEHGLWAVLVGRMLWPYAGIGWPKFDFVRKLVGGVSSHDDLTKNQIILGYSFIVISFVIGYILGYYEANLNISVLFAIPGVLLLVQARNDQVDVNDI